MPVTVKYIADTKDLEAGSDRATKAVKGVGDAADDAGKKAGGFRDALGGVSKVAGGFVLGSGILAAPGYLKDAAQAAAEDEQATIRLEQALRNANGSFDENIAKVNERIDAGADLVFADDDVRNSFQTLLAATDDVDEALRRQTVAMDLARGKNISLEQASTLLAKVNEENVDQFRRLGIEIPKTATEAEAMAIVQGKFAGQAEAYASSSAAQFEKFDQQMGELQETIGTALLPVFAALGVILADVVVPMLTTLAEDVAPQIGAVLGPAIAGIGTAFQAIEPFLLPIVAGIGAVAAVILGSMVPAIIAWTVAEWAKVAALVAGAAAFIVANAPIIAIAAALALLVAGIILVIQNWDSIVAKVPALGVAFDAVKEAIAVVLEWIKTDFIPGFMALYTSVADTVTKAVAFVREHWDEIRAVIQPAIEALVVIVTAQFEIIKTVIETAIKVTIGIVQTLMAILRGDWSAAWEEIKGIASDLWEGIKGVVGTAMDALSKLIGDKLDGVKGLWDDFTGKLGGARDNIAGVLTSMGDKFSEWFGRVTRPIDWVIERIQWLIDKINAIPDMPDISIPGSGIVGNVAGGVKGLFAEGVRNFPGGLAIVGEEGPELVRLPAGSDVYSNPDTQMIAQASRALNEGGVGSTGSSGPAAVVAVGGADGGMSKEALEALKTIASLTQRAYDYDIMEKAEWRGGMIDRLDSLDLHTRLLYDHALNEVMYWRKEIKGLLQAIARGLEVDHLADLQARHQSQQWTTNAAAAG